MPGPAGGRRASFLPPASRFPSRGLSPPRPRRPWAPRELAEVTLQGGRTRSRAASDGAGWQPVGPRAPSSPPGPRAYLAARWPPPAARALPVRAAGTNASARPPRPCSLRAAPGAGVRGTGRSERPLRERSCLQRAPLPLRLRSHTAGAQDKLTAERSLARGRGGRSSAGGRPVGVGWRGLRASGPAPSPGTGGRWGVGAERVGVAVQGVTRGRDWAPGCSSPIPLCVLVPEVQGDCSSGAAPFSPAHTHLGE